MRGKSIFYKNKIVISLFLLFAVALASLPIVPIKHALAKKKVRHYKMEQDIGTGEIWIFDCKELIDKRIEGEINEYTFKVSVYKKGESKAFQSFRMVTASDSNPFSFEDDLNADGFLDLRCLYFYGANGGSADWRIWSPSRQKFVRKPDVFSGFFSFYFIDEEKRQLYIHSHGSAIDGTEYTWQWSGEMELKLLRTFSHYSNYKTGKKERIHCVIVSSAGEKDEIICDYKYKMKEYEKRIDEIWGLDTDFLWKQKVKMDSGEKYTLRYTQEPLRNKKGKIIEGYRSYLYVLTADTYLEKRLKWKDSAEYESYSCEVNKGEICVTVNYKDNSKVVKQLK